MTDTDRERPAQPASLEPIAFSRLHALIALGLAVATFVLYVDRLDYVPPHLAHDEIIFSLHAQSIATTGHDVTGRLLPLYFQVTDRYWATPVYVYATALLLNILPPTETVVRLPNVMVGALDVALVYLLTLRIFKSHWQAVAAAVLLALTPAHFIHSRMAGDLIFPVPFLLSSLLGLVIYFENRDRRVLFGATSMMSLGCYSYLGAAAAMPLYFLLVCLTIGAFEPRPIRALLTATAGFVWPLIPVVVWLAWHPMQFGNQVQMYGLYDSSNLGPIRGLLELLSYSSVQKRLVLYHQFFSPQFLFEGGDSSLMNSTGQAGVFLTPLAVLGAVGIIHLIRHGRTPVALLVLAGLAVAPIASLLVLEVKINRSLIFLPFVAIVASCGARAMCRAKFKVWAVAAVLLLAVAPREFRAFHRDYMTEYRARSAFWFERNIRGALEDVIARHREHDIPRVYISRTPRWIDWYWKWYLAKAGDTELLARTTYAVPGEIDAATLLPGSVVFGEVEEVEAAPVFSSSNGATRVSRIADASGKVWFVVFER